MGIWFMMLGFNLLIPVIAVIPHAEKAPHNTFDKDRNRKERAL